MTEDIEIELSATRELLADAYKKLSGKKAHASDCSTSNAPAMRPGPCDCSYDGDNRSPESLHEAAEPLMKWLNLNGHPHCTILMDQTHVELLEGQVATPFTPPDRLFGTRQAKAVCRVPEHTYKVAKKCRVRIT